MKDPYEFEMTPSLKEAYIAKDEADAKEKQDIYGLKIFELELRALEPDPKHDFFTLFPGASHCDYVVRSSDWVKCGRLREEH